MSCLIVGDSIAVGIASHLNCNVNAKIGARSEQVSISSGQKYEFVVISVGSNDKNVIDISAANKLRNQIINANQWEERINPSNTTLPLTDRSFAKKVIWILPYDREKANLILQIASIYKDFIIDLHNYTTHDKIHPSNYIALSNDILKKI